MLNRLTLILRPSISYHAQIAKILREERFDFQFGTLKQDKGDTGTTEDVVLVTCVDFHDVGVVMEKLSGKVTPRSYLVDASRAIFSYHAVDRVMYTLGTLYQSELVLTYNSHITVGSNNYSFWEAP
ncbi:hypothetical protein [Kosakonia virus Kc318]|uniref:Uncharacterized protein n=1 Tax=Kosakonia virus Kc318 TaxID=2797327 RepID=A0AAE7TQI7_9CAUD|nr:hypothetical protein [Kosakonia virus Kc318]